MIEIQQSPLPEDLLVEVEVAAGLAKGRDCSVILIVVPQEGTSDEVEIHTRIPLNLTDLILADLLASRLRYRSVDKDGNWIIEK